MINKKRIGSREGFKKVKNTIATQANQLTAAIKNIADAFLFLFTNAKSNRARNKLNFRTNKSFTKLSLQLVGHIWVQATIGR